MSKGLKSLRKIEKKLSNCYGQDIAYDKETFDLFSDVGHELQALEIILKEFRFTFDDEEQSVMIDNCYTVIFHNKEKYDLLKEVLL